MGTIPLVEKAAGITQDRAVPVSTAAQEPLAVEALEDRVLPASDPVTTTAVPPAAPAPYVAAEHTLHAAIDFESVAAVADIGTDAAQPSPGVPAAQSTPPHPAAGEAEPLERRLDTFQEPAPENKVFNEAESNRNVFGLATIEPEAGASDMVKPSRDRGLFNKLVVEGSQPGESEPGSVASRGDASEVEKGAVAAQVAVQEVAEELGTGLVKAAIESRVEPMAKVTRGATVEASRAREHSDLLVQSVLKADPVTAAVTDQDGPIAEQADSGPQEGNLQEASSGAASDAERGRSDVQPSQRQQALHQVPAEIPSAAHDALFEGGRGVEVVLARPNNA